MPFLGRRGGLSAVALVGLLGALIWSPAVADSRAPSPPRARAAAQTLPPVTQSVLSPPRWYRADDGRFHLLYELELINGVALPVKLPSPQVLAAHGRRIENLSRG